MLRLPPISTRTHSLFPYTTLSRSAATQPFAEWDAQKHTRKERYDDLARDMQAVARRLLICGMHVHVGLDDDELRMDLMQQVAYFLPHLLALSTSSPFWRGEVTGLKRSEEHTSELQSLMRISSAVFC